MNELGSDIEHIDNIGADILEHAITYNFIDIVKYLVEVKEFSIKKENKR